MEKHRETIDYMVLFKDHYVPESGEIDKNWDLLENKLRLQFKIPLENFIKPKKHPYINFDLLNKLLFKGSTYYAVNDRAQRIHELITEEYELNYRINLDSLWNLCGIPKDRIFDKAQTSDAAERAWNYFVKNKWFPHIENNYTEFKEQKKLENNKDMIIGEDNICPTTKLVCDDECCPPGATCNLGGSGLNPISQPDGCPIMPR
jgi:hypothetical protein